MTMLMENHGEVLSLPVIALRGLVVFPNLSIQFDVGRKKSILAITDAMERDQKIFLVAQRDLGDSDPDSTQVYRMGVVAQIKQVLRHSEEGLRLFVQGLYRADIQALTQQDPFLLADVLRQDTLVVEHSLRDEALIRHTQTLFEEYIQHYKQVPPDIILSVAKQKDCGQLADFIASHISLEYEDKQEILNQLHPLKRLEYLMEVLEQENEILEIENEISAKAREQMEQNQREYFLREQMRAISYELGEDESPEDEGEAFREKILTLGLPEKDEQKLLKDCVRLGKMPNSSHEYNVLRNYLEICLDLPWNVSSEEVIDLEKAEKLLNEEHYGLTKVKERILESLAVRKLAPKANGQIICLVGPPGVGKTSIARSIARAVGCEYVRISLGGVKDESEIVGHRKTYVGSMPGRILSAIRQAGTNNPLILLDEIDKLCRDFRGDPASALLEVLDPEQNASFYDHYLEIPFDLSRVLFLTTANDVSTIPAPLLDRMDVIPLSSYTHEEKFQIATQYLIPKQLKKHGIAAKQLKITQSAVREIIDGYTREAGVRGLERNIAKICRQCAKAIVEDDSTKISVKKTNLEDYLGPKKYRRDEASRQDEVGLVNGLAWTSVGGELLPIEVAAMKGTGKLELTGNLGNVMKESARTAVTCVRTRAQDLGISGDFYQKMDLHIHVPEGAVPKDGPSAGIAMATSITSALSQTKIRHDVAMTGEITLQGRVLPIGGLKEKTMAAYRAGIKHVILPADNVSDLSEVDEAVKDAIAFHPVRRIDEVLKLALTELPKPQPKAAPAKEDAGKGAEHGEMGSGGV